MPPEFSVTRGLHAETRDVERTLVNGRMSSVMRSSLEDVWCIVRGLRRSCFSYSSMSPKVMYSFSASIQVAASARRVRSSSGVDAFAASAAASDSCVSEDVLEQLEALDGGCELASEGETGTRGSVSP